MATNPTPTGPAKDTAAQTPPAAPDADASAARIAELEAEVARLREQADVAATKAAEPDLPEGYVYVVDAAGAPMPSNPYVPRAWLDKDNVHLLPEGAKKATKEQEGAVKAMIAAARRPRL